MKEPQVYHLNIDREFKNLIRPLTKKEFVQLENNILADGCIDPIITWHGTIIDGHNRYKICHTHNIPFSVLEKSFECREDVIVWICAHQLGRRNISEETRRFLIGMQYQNEKISNAKKNAEGKNQFNQPNENPSKTDDEFLPASQKQPNGHATAVRIGQENNVSWSTVCKYGRYAELLNVIGQKVPELLPQILSGKYRFSHKNIAELAGLKPVQIRKVLAKLEQDGQQHKQYKNGRDALHSMISPVAESSTSVASIKDMPAFDPDAEIASLALTIPSWINSIERARQKSNIALVSEEAKRRLVIAAQELQTVVDRLISNIKETV